MEAINKNDLKTLLDEFGDGYFVEDGKFVFSPSIIEQGVLKCGFMEAYNLSYTDIYDFASAGNKMSLKKLEIKMGLPWDQPVSDVQPKTSL